MNDWLRGKKFRLLISILISACFMASVYFLCGIWFETSDDVAISELLSGKIIGSSEFHCPYVRTFISWPISLLYRLTDGIPWWGMFIFIVLFVVVAINLYYFQSFAKSIWQHIFIVFSVMIVFAAGIHIFGQAQYTAAAIMLAATGYMALCVAFLRKEKPNYVLFVLLELIACGVRDSSMILIQPIGLLSLLGALVYRDNASKNYRKVFKQMVIVIGAIGMILIVSKVDEAITFSNDSWEEYYKFNEVQAYLTDYERKISYEELESILDKYQVSKEDYYQTLEYRTWYGEDKLSKGCIDELLPVLKDIRSEEYKADVVFAAFKQLLFSSREFWGLHRLTALAFIIAFAVAFIVRKSRVIIPLTMTFMGYIVGLTFLALRNRFVLRVMMPYYISALLLLAVWGIMALGELNKGKTVKSVFAVLAISLAIFAISIGKTQFSYVRAQNRHVNAIGFQEGKEIMEYCINHPENKYVLDISYQKSVCTDIFETGYYKRANHVYSGSWYSMMPSIKAYSKDYIEGDFCFIVYEAAEYKGIEGAEYFAYNRDYEKKIKDKSKLSSGATILVYEIGKRDDVS